MSSAIASVLLLACPAMAGDLTGRWLATAQIGDASIPFKLQLASEGEKASGTFFDGARPNNSSSTGAFTGGRLHLEFPSYAATIDATVTGDTLDGDYTAAGKVTHIHAVKDSGAPPPVVTAPNIDGEWIIPYRSAKGENAWRLIIHQTGASAEAAILRIDGDTGTLDGRFSDGAFRLSHYAGERAAKLVIASQPDGSLKLVLTDTTGEKELSAVRPAAAVAMGATPTDPTTHTTVRDPNEPFAFSFPDLAGKTVANTDARFKGKVVLVNLMGSWCPNCHDEAPFLEALYNKRHKDGLEIVALDFEQPNQIADPQRLRAFIQRYGVTYTVLLAGLQKEVNAKVPQAVNLNAWPTTFFVGRDGKVKSVHVGFTSPGSGQRDVETRAAVEREVDALLKE